MTNNQPKEFVIRDIQIIERYISEGRRTIPVQLVRSLIDKLRKFEGRDSEYVQLLEELTSRLLKDIERFKRDYSIFEECSPPDWPRADFAKHCFMLWQEPKDMAKNT